MNDRIKIGGTLPPPLRPAPDMASQWLDTDQTFDTAAEVLVGTHRIDGMPRDVPVLDLRAQAVRAHDGLFTLEHLAGSEPRRALRATAFANLCGRLGAPVEFVRDRLPAPLQLATLNYLLGQSERDRTAMLRIRGEEITAIVSERYAALDAEELVETLRGALDRHGMLQEVRVRALATGLVDVLRLTFPAESHEIQVGDVSHVGLDVSTSSFGRSAIHIRGVLWRLRCMNGLRTPSTIGDVSLRHVGDAARLREGVMEAIPTAIAHARGLVDDWRRSVNTFVEELPALIESMRTLTEQEKTAVRDELGAREPKELPAQTSIYNLVNAVTSAAHSAEPARRLELEGIAGDLLTEQMRRAA